MGGEHFAHRRTCSSNAHIRTKEAPFVRPEPHPMHALYHRIMGIDSFALDGDTTVVTDRWEDRPHLCKTPPAGA